MGTPPTPPFPSGPVATPQAGQTIAGKWHLDAVLGSGAMATVFEARHRNGKRVAIKILHPEVALDDHALGRFQREGYLANAVEHPGVVSVLDEGVTDEGLPFLVMEYLEGESLGARLSRLGRPLSPPDVLAIGVAVLDALGAAHERGLIHRDLKPDNIFLCTNGSVKILDFGIARLREMPLGVTTRNGLMLGTLAFMAREQALGRVDLVDQRSDLYSVAATLINALTRRHVFEAPTMNQMLVRLVTRDPPPVRELVPGLPEPIASALDRGLVHDQAQRWQSAAEMREALLVAALESDTDVPERPSLVGYEPPAREPLPLGDLLSSMQIPAVPQPTPSAPQPDPSRPSGNALAALDSPPHERPPHRFSPTPPQASLHRAPPAPVPSQPTPRRLTPSRLTPSQPEHGSPIEPPSSIEPTLPPSTAELPDADPRASAQRKLPVAVVGAAALVALLAALGLGRVGLRAASPSPPPPPPASSAPAAASSQAPAEPPAAPAASSAAPAASSVAPAPSKPGKRRGPQRPGDLGWSRH